MSLGLGSGPPFIDLLTLWIPSPYIGGKNLNEQKSTFRKDRSVQHLVSIDYIYISIPRANHLSIVDMAEPHQRCFRLLQLPSDVLYLRLAAGQSGTPLFGQLRRSGSLWLRRDRSVSVGAFGNLEGKFAGMRTAEENGGAPLTFFWTTRRPGEQRNRTWPAFLLPLFGR